jgi:hypothetical protein
MNTENDPMLGDLRVWRILLTAIALFSAPTALAEVDLVWSCSSATVGSPVTSCAGTASWQQGPGKLVASATAYGDFSTGTWRLWENVPLDEYVYVCGVNVTVGSTANCPQPGGLILDSFVIKSALAPPTSSVRIGTAALV